MDHKPSIESLLRQAFSQADIRVEDESWQHAGHSDWRPGQTTHIKVTIVSASFEGLSLPDRHRLVYQALAPLMADALHAVRIRAVALTERQGLGG